MKKKKESFEDIVYNATFEIDGYGRMPDKAHFYCSFCGGRGKNFVRIKRNDGELFRVGMTCLSRVKLELPVVAKKFFSSKGLKEEQREWKQEKKKRRKKVVEKVPEEISKEEVSSEELDKLFESLD